MTTPRTPVTVERLVARQRKRLRLGEHAGLTTVAQLSTFVGNVGIALRYGPTDTLPLASVYQAVARPGESEQEAQRRATKLTNALIEKREVTEVNVIADRLTLVIAPLVHPLLVLVRGGRTVDELELSDTARRVLEILGEHPRPTAGFVRARLGVPSNTWPNPADEALTELQRALVIYRGSTDVPETGAAYLGKEGIPYRTFSVIDERLAAMGSRSIEDAAGLLISVYVYGAVFATRRKLASMFKRCMSAAELDRAIERLTERRRLEIVKLDGKELICVGRSPT